jgi:hypothetical protein
MTCRLATRLLVGAVLAALAASTAQAQAVVKAAKVTVE